MKNRKTVIALLATAGLIAAGIGGSILFTPEEFYGAYNINLGGNVNLLSDIRAMGGALLIAGILMLAGVFVPNFTFTSMVIAAATYLSYGTSRIIGMTVDGMPESVMVAAAGLELVIGMAALATLFKFSKTISQNALGA